MGTFLVAPIKTEHDCCKDNSDMEMTSPSPSGKNQSDDSYRKTAAFRDFFTSKYKIFHI